MKNFIILISILLLNFTKILSQFRNNGAIITVRSGAFIKIDTDFINEAGSDFQNYSKVIFTKNITNNQVMSAANANNGIWEFGGTTKQSIDGNSPLWVSVADFTNPAGVELNNILKINTEANFNNGLVKTSYIYPIFFEATATIPTAPTDASHVVGPVIKLGTDPFTFPIGDATKYQPIKAEFIVNSDGLEANYVAGDAGAGGFTTGGTEATLLGAYNSGEYWDLTPYNESTTSAEITLYWDNYNDSFPNEPSSRRVAHKTNGNWQNEGQATTVSGTGTAGSVKSHLISSWSPFALGFVAAIPLPIRLISFSGKKVEDGNQLIWKTSTEINASHFEIERSSPLTPGGGINNSKFEKIGEVKANGGPAEKVNYEFVDQAPPLGVGATDASWLYRLKMIDLDGKFDYSKIISIKNDGSQFTKLKLFPNPAISVLNIENISENTIEIVNISGQKQAINILSQSDSKSSIDVSDLPTGLYFLKAGNEVRKFLKQ